MTLKTCDTPRPADLAVSRPGDMVEYFSGMLEEQGDYWTARRNEAEAAVDLASHTIAHILVKKIADAKEASKDVERSAVEPKVRGNVRRYALGVLAASAFAHSMFSNPKITFEDAIARNGDKIALLPDLYLDEDYRAPPPRFHMTPEAFEVLFPQTPDSRWYREEKLFICRKKPAQPSAGQLAVLDERGYQVDFDTMLSLFPYLASPRIRRNNPATS